MKGLVSVLLVAPCLVISACVPGLRPINSPDPHLTDTWTRSADGMVMVYVPAGEFEMGSTEGDNDEQPVHTVTLDGFWIDRSEVTNAQFAAFLNQQAAVAEAEVTWLDLEDESSLIEQVGDEYRPKSGYADHPVIEVSWYGGAAYCEWVGSRLPTEAEWEYAARGPEERVFPWGDVFDCAGGNFRDGRPCFDGYEKTAPVGSFPAGASWCGALDMAGNVWEWVADWYGHYPFGPRLYPTGPTTGERRVVRGGSFHFVSYSMRGANRNVHRPGFTNYNVGFRCARDSDMARGS